MLRHDGSLAAGANVNFIARVAHGGWRIRTYERGVEGETLACGTGAVASGVMLEAWGLSDSQTALETRSGRVLTVTVRHLEGAIRPSLRGEGRIVFTGELGEL
jgi:diaminopimelate epimerase